MLITHFCVCTGIFASTVVAGAFEAYAFWDRYNYGNQKPMNIHGGRDWPPPPFAADKVQVTTHVTSGTSTLVEVRTPAFDAPWDMVTASADGDGYLQGDYMFPLNDEGTRVLGSLFDEIAEACPSAITKRQEVADENTHQLNKRVDQATAECARDYIAGSQFNSWDSGFATSSQLMTFDDLPLSVEVLGSAAVVIFSMWLLCQGNIDNLDQTTTFEADRVGLINNDLVNPNDDDSSNDLPDTEYAYINIDTSVSDLEFETTIHELEKYQRSQSYSIRKRLHDFPETEPTCQKSQLAAPATSTQGEPSATNAMAGFCKDNAGKNLDTDEPSVWKHYTYDDFSYWLVASTWVESNSTYCEFPFIDEKECTATFSHGFDICDPGVEWLHGSRWQGECVEYTLTIDAATSRESPPTWDEAGEELPDDPGNPSDPPDRPDITNSCAETSGHISFTVDQAQTAIDGFCSADRHVDVPLIGSQDVDGIEISMAMSKSTATGCPTYQDGYIVTIDDCKLYFLSAVNNCNIDTTTQKYGNTPLIWKSPAGCIAFLISAVE